MHLRPIYLITLCLCLTTFVVAQNNASLDLSESGIPMVIPRMDTTSMMNIPVVLQDDGLLVYTSDTKSVNFYDGVLNIWFPLKGRNGIDGASGANGPNGPQGPRGMARAGSAGPDGTAMITMLHCWDRDLDQIADPGDDINNDGVWNTLDCIGNKGPKGANGLQPASNIISTDYIHTTSGVANTSDLSNPSLTSTSKVFVQNVDTVVPMYTEFSSPSTWSIKTTDGSNISAGTDFIIVIIN